MIKFKGPKRLRCLESAEKCFRKRRCHVCFMALKETVRIRLIEGGVVDIVEALEAVDFTILGESFKPLQPDPLGLDLTTDYVDFTVNH